MFNVPNFPAETPVGMCNFPTYLNEPYRTLISQQQSVHYNNAMCQQPVIPQIPSTIRPLWESDDRFLNPTQYTDNQTTWCEIGGRKAIPKRGIISFSAKQKQGKSLATYALTLPLLNGTQFGPLKPNEKPKSIIVFDLEMGEHSIQQRLRLHYSSLGEARNKFGVVPLLGKDIHDRQDIIQETVNKYNPDIVIIDQVAKLVRNINDPVEATSILHMLELIGTSCSCWCVIHENKGSNSDPRGHLGTELMNATVEAYTVQKTENVFHIRGVWSRDSDMDASPDVCFTYDSSFGIQAAKPPQIN